MKKIYLVLLIYTFLYVMLYFLTLNFNYVEGDDASTILYHLCGKNQAVQSPYASYHSGFDWLLSSLNFGDEASLRSFSIFISFISGYFALCFIAVLLDKIFSKNTTNSKYIFLALLPFILPDFIFHSLILNSSNISFAFALASLVCFLNFFDKKRWHYLIASIILMALSVPFRWSILTIFPMFFSLLILDSHNSLYFKLKIAVLHSASALSLGILFIYVSGYELNDILQVILWGRDVVEGAAFSPLGAIAAGSAFFTPSLLILFAAGIFVVFTVSKRHLLRIALFAFLPMIPFFILGFAVNYKFVQSLLPVLLALALAGFLLLSKHKTLRTSFYIILLLSWFVGIKIEATGTAAGPGFEQTLEGKYSQNSIITERNMNERVKIKKVYPALAGGFYMPMPEGPRPLYGFFYVVFNGGWKQNIEAFTNERKRILNILKNKKVFYLQDRRSAFFQCDLYDNGYKTNTAFIQKGDIEYRDFLGNNDTIRVSVISDRVSKTDFAAKFLKENDQVIFMSAYSSMILNLAQQFPDAELIGNYSIKKCK